MARITPSIAARAIEQTYPWAKERADGVGGSVEVLGADHAATIGMILAIVDAIPDELLPFDTEGHLAIVASVGAMRSALQNWSSGAHPSHVVHLRPLPAIGGEQPVVAILKVLRHCPDEAPSNGVSGIEFVSDPQARQSIRTDISVAHRALGNGEYKAATVLAGSVIEALLLWAIGQLKPELFMSAIENANAERLERKWRIVSKAAPEFWSLAEFIDVALAAKLIDETTAVNLRLSNDYRNLIHPGRVLRSGDDASLATALSALGGMERLIEVLSRRSEIAKRGAIVTEI
jgi:hypothetical protein